MKNVSISETPTQSQLIEFKIAIINFLRNINKPELSDLDQEIIILWKSIYMTLGDDE